MPNLMNCEHMEAGVCLACVKKLIEAEREACAKKLPDVLFDGYSVMQQLDKRGQARTSQDNVSDVLDAVVRIMRSNAGHEAAAKPVASMG